MQLLVFTGLGSTTHFQNELEETFVGNIYQPSQGISFLKSGNFVFEIVWERSIQVNTWYRWKHDTGENMLVDTGLRGHPLSAC